MIGTRLANSRVSLCSLNIMNKYIGEYNEYVYYSYLSYSELVDGDLVLKYFLEALTGWMVLLTLSILLDSLFFRFSNFNYFLYVTIKEERSYKIIG